MTVPVIQSLQAQNPRVKITVVTKHAFVPLFHHLHSGVTVHPFFPRGQHKGILGLWRLTKELRALNITAIADLHSVLRSKILKLMMLNYHWESVVKDRKEKRNTVAKRQFKPLRTMHERYADVFRKMGFKLDLSKGLLGSIKMQIPAVLKFNSTERLIGLAPFAGYPGKTYPIDLTKLLVQKLERFGKVLLFGGGEKETSALKQVEAQSENAICVAGIFELSEEIKLISNLDVMVAMDSSNAHMAAMLGVDVISIWGVTHPFLGFAPFGQPESNNLVADRKTFPKIPTSVYGNKMPDGYERAIATVTPEMIEDLVEKRLKHHRNQL